MKKTNGKQKNGAAKQPYNKLIIGDNLNVLPRLRPGEFDFIYLDPPFNTNRIFRYLSGSAHVSGGKFSGENAFDDVWEWDEECELIAAAWSEKEHQNHEIFRYINMFDNQKERRLRAYLTNMAVRLMLMRPLMKTSGSVWLHCDRTASHYIKILMDKVFGRGRFINEMVWYYKNASRGTKRFAHAHDVILGYSASAKWFFNRPAVLAPFESGMTAWRCKQRGEEPPKGKTPDDVIIMPALNANDKTERTGYATQKPRALLEFLMKAFCPPNGVVLDPFCGCGTTIDAAIHSNRQFVGVDINKDVPDFIRQRRDGNLLFNRIDTILWDKLFTTREFELQSSKANENREAEIRIARKMNGTVTPSSGDSGVDVILPGVVVSVKNGLTVQLNALREIEGAAAHHEKKGVLMLTRRDIPLSWREYANKSDGKIAVISEKELDEGNVPAWLRTAMQKKKD